MQKMTTDDMKPIISANINASSVINLPQSTGSSDAEGNTSNGVAFVVDYDENSLAPNGGYASATCTATVYERKKEKH